ESAVGELLRVLLHVARLDLTQPHRAEERDRPPLELAAVVGAGRLADAAGGAAVVGVDPRAGIARERRARRVAVVGAANVDVELGLLADRRLHRRRRRPAPPVAVVAVAELDCAAAAGALTAIEAGVPVDRDTAAHVAVRQAAE